MATSIESPRAALEGHLPGFKACFGGEELKRATASLTIGLGPTAFVVHGNEWVASTSVISGNGTSGEGNGHALKPLNKDAEADLATRELLRETRLYEIEEAAHPLDFDSLYRHGLVLQELASKATPCSPEELGYLSQACEKYEAALLLKPDSYTALYNLGVALSDQARVLRVNGDVGAARGCLHMASHKYALALAAQPVNPQALNNWGLVLQELSADVAERGERDSLIRAALEKFRCAIRLRPGFDRGCYNLGTVCQAYAGTLQSELSAQLKGTLSTLGGGPADLQLLSIRQGREASVRVMFTIAAQYICLAWALQQQKDVYRKSLAMVRQMLPLPFLRAGYLAAPLPTGLGTVDEVWERGWFVLDHLSLRTATSLESSLSAASTGLVVTPQLMSPGPGASPSALASAEQPLVLPLRDISTVRRCCDPTLPAGEAFWVSLSSDLQGVYLIADDADSADAWVDALLLCQHIVNTRSTEALAEALAPGPHHHHHGHAGRKSAATGIIGGTY